MQLFAALRRHRDLVIAVVLTCIYVAELLLYPRADRDVAVPLAIATAMTLVLRRRAPMVVFLIVVAGNFAVVHFAPRFDANSIAFVAIFLFNLYSLGANARALEAWLGAVGVLATVVGFVIGDGAHQPADVFFALAFVGTPWAAGLVVRLRSERERELRARNLALAEETERAIAAERARIARELHDVVSHAIAVTVLQARGARKMVGSDDGAVKRALAAIEQTNTAAMADMRRLLSLLRDADDPGGRDAPAPSLEALDRLVDQVRGSGLAVELEIGGEPVPVPPGLDLSAYRIVQEALTNVLKHAGPDARARVEVRYGEDELQVVVTNTGIVDVVPGAAGHGLVGIRERASVAGGSVDAGPCEGGYAVHARLPYLTEAR